MKKSFFNRLIIFYLFIVLLLAIISIYITININNKFRKTILSQWETQMLFSTRLAALNVENFITKYYENLLTIQNQPDIVARSLQKDTTLPKGFCILCNFYETHRHEIESIQLTDNEGNVLIQFPDPRIHKTEHVLQKLNFDRYDNTITLLDFHPKSQSSLIYILTPVKSGDSVVGKLSWKISISKIVEKYINPFISENSGYLWLIDSNLNILAHHEKSFVGLNAYYILKDYEYTGKVGRYSVKNSSLYLQEARNFLNNIRIREYGSGNYVDFAHNEYSLAVFNTINLGTQKWTIILSIPYRNIFEPVRKNNLKTYFIELIIIFLIAVTGLIFYKISRQNVVLEKEALYLAELAKSAEELRIEKQKRLTALLEGQEKERRRISREIHDSIGQQLLAMKLKLENSCNDNYPDYREIHDIVIKTIAETREISNDLAPVGLQESRLDEAIKQLTEKFQNTSGIHTDFVSYGIPEKMDISVKTYLYRIVQEGLNNIMKHSEATQADIQLLGNEEQLTLIIQDNGKGFEKEKINRIKGNGLSNIMERVTILQGSLTIDTSPGKGCCITIKINLL